MKRIISSLTFSALVASNAFAATATFNTTYDLFNMNGFPKEVTNGGIVLQGYVWDTNTGSISDERINNQWPTDLFNNGTIGLVSARQGAYNPVEEVGFIKQGNAITNLGEVDENDQVTFLPYKMSDDASVVIGNWKAEYHNAQFNLWTKDNGDEVIDMNLMDVSPNGRYIIGRTQNLNNNVQLIDRVNQETINLPLDQRDGHHAVVSSNGVVASTVQYGYYNSQVEAAIWKDGQVTEIGSFGLTRGSKPLAISEDGNIVVGYSYSNDEDHKESRPGGNSHIEAFIWDKKNGIRSLEEVLKNDYDVDLNGWTLEQASAISNDGFTIAGRGNDANGKRGFWSVTIGAECVATSW